MPLLHSSSSATVAAAISLGACVLLWACYPDPGSYSSTFTSSINLNKVLDATSLLSGGRWSSPSPSHQDNDNGDYQISTFNQTFPDFFSQYSKDDLVWLTLADKFFSETCTTHLQHFVKNLPPYIDSHTSQAQLQSRGRTSRQRKHRLVTLCIDPGCMETCTRNNWTCYGEYELSRPEIIFPSTWPKLKGLTDILETGRDAVFVDSDVFFRSNPFDRMEPLGAYDWQIQDEAIEGNVNTGFFHIMPTPQTIAHWKGVLAMDMKEVSRDQHNTNTLLGTESLRKLPKDNMERDGPDYKDTFVSKNDISINVIPTEIIYSYHLSFSWPRLHASDAAAWHGTCLDSPPLKYLLPRERGFWGDVDGYYSSIPGLLRLPALSGTAEELLEQMKQFATMAVQTNRSMIPPAVVTVALITGDTVLRDFYSVFPVDELVFDKSLPLLESSYIQHALPYYADEPEIMMALLAENRINVAAYGGVEQVIDALNSQDWNNRLSITLANYQAGQMGGRTMQELHNLRTCARLDQAPGCAQTCRKS